MSDHNWEAFYSLKPGDTFVEVGAFYGDDVHNVFPKVGKQGRAVFVEPNPAACKIMGIIINEIGASNFKVINNPAWKEKCKIDFYNFGGTTSIVAPLAHREHWIKQGLTPTEVNAVTVDYIAEVLKINTIDLLVMDVEGVEFEVIQGCYNLLNCRQIKNMSICVYHKQETKDEVVSYLDRFSKWMYGISGPLPVLHARLLEEGR